MKKLALISVVCFAFVLTGCNFIAGVTNKTPEELHNEAVAKIGEYAESLATKKIDKADYLTDEAKEQLKAEVAKLKEDIIKKIQDLHDKAMEKKLEKQNK